MKSFTSPRARRPLKARVMAVTAEGRIDERRLVHRGGAALGAPQQRRAELGGRGPGAHDGGDIGSGHQSPAAMTGTGTSWRTAVTRARSPHPASGAVSSSNVPDARRPRSPGRRRRRRPASAARDGLGRCRDGDHHLRADTLQLSHDLGAGAPEGEAHHRNRVAGQELELVRPAVVVPAGDHIDAQRPSASGRRLSR